MWSEHCSYKNSIFWLKQLPKDGSRILAKAGEENAGLVDIGDGMACAFKIESHNHPSAIEPYQGAATGVGGIHRDIFTMGARPIAALNSLRFGDLSLDKTKWLLRGISKGIGDYGNSFGVPTVAGEVYFDESYNVNPLVNAMSVGIVEIGKTVSATSYGVGNPVFIIGSATGKDGIHGATFASGDIDESSAKKLPSVQVGDPFQEKLLLEATLEAIQTGSIIGMQDMGAAGIACSTSEMSAKGEHGMDINLDEVPTRQENMKAFEMLLSESQERMLVVLKKGEEQSVIDIFEKWDLHCKQIGIVTESPNLRFYQHGNLVAEVPAESLVLGGGAPVYEREYSRPTYFDEIEKFRADDIPIPENLTEIARFLISHPNIASKRFIYEQYDSMVQTNSTNTNQPSDAAVIRLKGTNKGLAMKVDCNPYYVLADPEKGTAIAVAEAARNIVCSGATPVAVTNNLNFGNPYNPEVFYQFVGAIKGMSSACLKFDTPVTGGNVSFYNQSSDQGPVMPTPTIGMLGVMDDINLKLGLSFQNQGDLIYLLGKQTNDFSSSQYLIKYLKKQYSPAPYFDIDEELRLHHLILELNKSQLLISAHDLSEGGLFVALAESCMLKNLGINVTTDPTLRRDAVLFGEGQGRIIISCSSENQSALEKMCLDSNVPHTFLGNVSGNSILIDGIDYGSVEIVKDLYDNALGKIMAG